MGSFESFDFFKTSEYCWKLKERSCESGIKRRLFLSVSGTVAQAKRKKRVRSIPLWKGRFLFFLKLIIGIESFAEFNVG